ncbi:gamma-glutamylcyclotransferase family protein [Palleronia abyssalis]|uniref:Gamma-glutamylcyclotransferase family protein ytfP n=1 Tax=Palleronia abyssalis TaxID=1501240 RepID=A0A2R8BTV9_9RHOB|nr:gamma-glutamylcyclotransferase family protein [Palleronia abyssalis]SPJ23609.1 Gamma-glutamylcyclotransferase family protein ytfP [Palleronia abyssalis]
MENDPFIGHRVFVYGTLRRGFVNNEATLAFRNGATFLSEGRVPGTMYSVGWYPALIEDGDGHVTGEVWEISEPGIMHLLDEYEGLFDEGPPEYQRAIRAVDTPTGPIDAWVYIYAHEVNPMHLIPTGNWADAFNDA